MSQRVPRVLYHYCSLSTFKSILDNKSIWLSDIRRSNDSLELQWIMGKCQSYILQAWVDYVEAVKKERGLEVLSLEHFDRFKDLYNLVSAYDADDDTKNWVFCLSEKADDLGQWRGYADDGKGIAIGFNSAVFKTINQIGQIVRSTTVDLKFDKVHYSERDIKAFFDRAVGAQKITVDMSPDDVIEKLKRALGFSYMFAPMFKNDKFRDEKEWRIVYSMHFGDLMNGQKPGIPNAENKYTDTLTLEKYAFAQRGNTLVSHLELGLPQMKRAIHNITIGPKSDITPTDVKLYLISLGLLDNFADDSIEVQRSAISYR